MGRVDWEIRGRGGDMARGRGGGKKGFGLADKLPGEAKDRRKRSSDSKKRGKTVTDRTSLRTWASAQFHGEKKHEGKCAKTNARVMKIVAPVFDGVLKS